MSVILFDIIDDVSGVIGGGGKIDPPPRNTL